jgi:DNA-binding SARP family transcriptional activator
VASQVVWLERLDLENGNLRAALSWAISSGEIAMAAWLGWALWPFWWLRNRQPEGRRWMEQILPRRKGLPSWLRTRAVIAAEVMAYGQGDDEAAVRYAKELEDYSREAGGDALADAFVHVVLGLVAAARGDLKAGIGHLEQDAALFHEAGEDGLAVQARVFFGTVLLLQGDHERARQEFEEALALGRGMGDRVSVQNALFNLAQLALAEGDYEAAFRRFTEGIVPSEELGDRGNVAHILEGLGIVAGAQGEAVRAARLLGVSEALISALGLRGHTYYQLDRDLYERVTAGARARLGEAAFEVALGEGRAMSLEQAVEYALDEPAILDKELPVDMPSPAHPPAEHSEKGAHPPAAEAPVLRVFALGRARVERDGLPIDSPDWTNKPRELLYYLLSYPEGRTKGQVGLALWPEASASQLRSVFHDTLYRLRRALGSKGWVSYRNGRYAFERSLPYRYDVEAFEESLSEAGRLRTEAPEQAIGLLKEAADLYGGDFLEEFADSEWALARQEGLRRAYQESLLLLGRLLLAQVRHAEAADAYRRAIDHDRFVEEAHRGFMRSQAALGERSTALRHYEDLVEMLYEQLGTLPATETTTLYERLRADEEP